MCICIFSCLFILSFLYPYFLYRFLWTTGHLLEDGWVPWDIQVVNAAPNTIIWKKASTKLNVKVPGLYRYCIYCLLWSEMHFISITTILAELVFALMRI